MHFNDTTYYNLIKDIDNNNEFQKLKSIKHHGLTRYNHSYRVSYYSYIFAKKLDLNVKEVARAGLLHDFFFDVNNTKIDKLKSFYNHPKKALEITKNDFEINKLEENIIKSHMFPISLELPKYKESLLVSIVDKIVASYEFYLSYKYKVLVTYYLFNNFIYSI